LEGQCYRILEATTAEIALELFKLNDIDLVITDHLLSTIRGTELARQLKQLKPSVPLALLTGLPDAPDGIEYAVRLEQIWNELAQTHSRLSGFYRASKSYLCCAPRKTLNFPDVLKRDSQTRGDCHAGLTRVEELKPQHADIFVMIPHEVSPRGLQAQWVWQATQIDSLTRWPAEAVRQSQIDPRKEKSCMRAVPSEF
jgi:CheY-like chemotaxis protein